MVKHRHSNKRKATTQQPIVTEVQNRKARRKEERLARKRNKSIRNKRHDDEEDYDEEEEDMMLQVHETEEPNVQKQKRTKVSSKQEEDDERSSDDDDDDDDPYGHLDDATAAAMRADDAEIADLEAKLGISSKKGFSKLKKEYAKLEGYGDDFGDFLDDLDGMTDRIKGGGEDDYEDYGSEEDDEEIERFDEKDSKKKKKKKEKSKEYQDDEYDEADPYGHLDDETAAAMRADDAEIAALESKLGIKEKKGSSKLKKEYSKLEGYGDDFFDFLEDLDDLGRRCASSDSRRPGVDSDEESDSASEEGDDSDGEEVVLMKDQSASYAEELDYADSLLKEEEDEENDNDSDSESDGDLSIENEHQQHEDDDDDNSDDDDGGGDSSSSSHSEDEQNDNVEKQDKDHDEAYTYHPSTGEDIYGNKIDKDGNVSTKPAKYVPPHLRNKQSSKKDDDDYDNDANHQEVLRDIRRSLNNLLNRLSDDTLESVTKSISALYSSFPTHDVSECLWENVKHTCVSPSILLSGLIPVYVACLAGVHIHTGNEKNVGFGGFVLEKVVVDLLSSLRNARKGGGGDDGEGNDEAAISDKEPSNLILILCYLYNYGVVHCGLVYDIVRDLIDGFSEVDVEVLLLILSYCGHQLRSDDPAALKDIVLLVQNRTLKMMEGKKEKDKNCEGGSDQNGSAALASSSRVQYMISAMTDLKNNKRKKKDIAIGEKAAFYRKAIGRMKSAITSKGFGGRSSSDACVRITLQDILDIDTKGRWWKVGASWIGNQARTFHHDDENDQDEANDQSEHKANKKAEKKDGKDDKLLVLASKQRMNTDTRRSIFCIVMGSTDCDDAFEKLVRAGMLKSRSERETVRVLVECCGQEKSYNPFYAHLACRICDFQPKCRFTFQLAYWDSFKQFEDMKARRSANLAKLLAHLVGVGHCLSLNILKVISVSPEDMPEMGVIFLTIFFTTLFEMFDSPAEIVSLFGGIPRQVGSKSGFGEDNSAGAGDDGDELRDNLSVFFLQYLKSSPKNVKKSKFRANYKAAVKACETDGLDSMIPMK